MTSPQPKATKLCIKCAETLEHSLVPSDYGCDWKCTRCSNQLHAYSFEDMARIVRTKVFNIPDKIINVPLPENYRVFLKNNFDKKTGMGEELEATTDTIAQHLKATGKLPQVGKPLYALVRGLPVPFGEVVRIEVN